MTGEIWKPIPGFPRYYASSLGRIRGPFRILRGYRNAEGRYVVGPAKAGRYPQVGVGRLVCLAFHGEPPPDRPWALHRDDDLSNNTPGNLYWGNGKDNQNDAKKNGKRHKSPIDGTGP